MDPIAAYKTLLEQQALQQLVRAFASTSNNSANAAAVPRQPPSLQAAASAKPPAGTDANFPSKLHYMLSETAKDGMEHVVSWQPHGRCFVVHNIEEFTKEILPLWFRQTKFPSFQRQLNLYGFKRISQGRDKGGYWHPHFIRSDPDQCKNIVRFKVKGKGPRKPASPEDEPDFYKDFVPSVTPSSSITSASHQYAIRSQLGGMGANGNNILSLASALGAPPPALTVQQEQNNRSSDQALQQLLLQNSLRASVAPTASSLSSLLAHPPASAALPLQRDSLLLDYLALIDRSHQQGSISQLQDLASRGSGSLGPNGAPSWLNDHRMR